jgi:hypothetical protein
MPQEGWVIIIEKTIPRAFIPNEMRFSTVRIMSYDDRNPQGVLESQAEDEPQSFQNLTQLLLMLDHIADELGCPQRSRTQRFLVRNAPPARGESGQTPPERPLASFRIGIMFRQNMSWQGTCEWLEENKSANFRSALELVQLMDGVLAGPQKPREPKI